MTYVRVRDNETGHHLSIPEELYARNQSAFTVLKQQAAYPDGSPVKPKHKTTVAESAAGKTGQQADTEKEKS